MRFNDARSREPTPEPADVKAWATFVLDPRKPANACHQVTCPRLAMTEVACAREPGDPLLADAVYPGVDGTRMSYRCRAEQSRVQQMVAMGQLPVPQLIFVLPDHDPEDLAVATTRHREFVPVEKVKMAIPLPEHSKVLV